MREPRAIGYSVSVVAGLIVIVIAIAAYAAPLVSIQKPQDKEIISGTADIHVTYVADSASPIERVQVFIDNQLVKDYRLDKPNLQGSVAFRWDFTLATPSRISISARAQDSSCAVGATGIKVEVRRNEGAESAPAAGGTDRTAPTVDIYYPAEGQLVKGEIRVKADVSDDVGVRTVIFFLDGEFKTMMMNSPNYSSRFDTTRMAEGPHVVRVSAYDARENEGRAERTFVVQNREATAAQENGESRIATKSDAQLPPPPVPEVPPAVGQPAPDVQQPPVPKVEARAGAETAKDVGTAGVRPDLVAKLPEPTGSGSRPITGRPEGGVSASLPPAAAGTLQLLSTRAEACSDSGTPCFGNRVDPSFALAKEVAISCWLDPAEVKPEEMAFPSMCEAIRYYQSRRSRP